MKEILEFIQDEMPLGVMVFDEKKRITYHNSNADKYLKRYCIGRELTAMAERIFRERQTEGKDALSKDICFRGAVKGMPANLSIRHLYSEEPYPRVSFFISSKLCNSHLNVEAVISRYTLTKKEAEIVRQLVRGLKNDDIARELNMQKHTVKDHLRHIYTKCGVKGKLELVRNIAA